MTRWISVLVLAGCAVSGDVDDRDDVITQELAAADAARVLDLVNYPGVDQDGLDHAVGLDARAARGIATHRAGPDGRFPSNDDRTFTTLAELDAVPYVGDVAFAKLADYAQANPAPSSEYHEGVAFRGWEAEIVLWGANSVPIGVLNGLLDNRAAANIVAARPLASLAELAAVPLVGTSALRAMRGQSTPWWAARAKQQSGSLAGTFDGVAFDEATAQQALEIANTHTRDEMVAGGVYGNGASVIVGNRPYVSLAQVADVSGVGPSTMQGLHAYAAFLLAAGARANDDDACAVTSDCTADLAVLDRD
jgi:DNA uptake protein ComE-like DNA-binding protein